MDYPKSVPSVGLVNGKFVDEDVATGVQGSLIPSAWGNAVTDELLAVVKGAGLVPAEHNNGQVFSAIRTMLLAQSAGRLIGVQVFTASGTYTPTPGMTSCIIEVQGGGGSSAGATNPSAGNVSLGSSGAAGAYAKGLFTAAAVGASKAVTVGTGGVSPVGGNGIAGGASAVGSLITAPGGLGGGVLNNAVPPANNGNAGVSSPATGGNIFSILGYAGAASTAYSSTVGISGNGGDSPFGAGGGTNIFNGIAQSGLNPGTGGGGIIINNVAGVSVKGGDGRSGLVIIMEYS